MSKKTYHVLFLCTGNSARSIMAEALLNTSGEGRFRAYSAGSHPTGRVNLLVLEMVKLTGYPLEALRSKSWDEFARPDSSSLDFVFTVCDNAAGEVCPVWPGQPITAHWGVEDPAAVQGTEEEKRQAFWRVFVQLQRRIQLFTCLPIDKLDRLSLQREVTQLGRREP